MAARSRRGKRPSAMLADAVIVGGLSFFSSLGAASFVPFPDAWKLALFTSVMNAGSAFFLQLAVQRGVRRPM